MAPAPPLCHIAVTCIALRYYCSNVKGLGSNLNEPSVQRFLSLLRAEARGAWSSIGPGGLLGRCLEQNIPNKRITGNAANSEKQESTSLCGLDCCHYCSWLAFKVQLVSDQTSWALQRTVGAPSVLQFWPSHEAACWCSLY